MSNWTDDKDDLIHALDHVLSDLDVEPWTDYSADFDAVKDKIDAAIKQIKHIQKCLGKDNAN